MKIILFLLFTLTVTLCYDDDFSSDKYMGMTRSEKFDKMWYKINENQSPNDWYSSFSLAKIFFIRMKTSFEHYGDSMPSGRQKLIHTVGVMGQVEFVAEQDKRVNPYTGIFQGASHVLLRLSLAKKPDFSKRKAEDAEDNFTPGFGVKFIRDGVHSFDTVAMFGVNGQPSWNFFKNEFSTHIPEADGVALKILNFKFSEATKYTNKMGNLDGAVFDQFGNKENDPVFPYKLVFRPTDTVKNMFSDYFTDSYMKQLPSIPENTALYDVLASSGPNSRMVKIGSFVLRMKFRPSYWGDTGFWIRHNYWDEDIKFHPDWQSSGLLQDPEFQKDFEEKYGFQHP
jgi:hypothetical protein